MESMETVSVEKSEREKLLDQVLRAVGLELVELPEFFWNAWHFACQRVDMKGDGWVGFSRDDASWFSFRVVYLAPRMFVSREEVFEKLMKTKCFVWKSLSLETSFETREEMNLLVWENPFFGCMSDDELRVKMDLLCLGEREVNREKES